MARRERRIDPEAGPVQRFAWELRRLRQAAGQPSYRELAERVHYSPSVLSEAASGRALPSLAVTVAYARGCGGDPREWEERWRDAAGDGEDRLPPYLGLSVFDVKDADRFFGRQALTDELLARVGAAPMLAVVGASGSGKSSLLRAGLLPRLAGPAVVVTPGADPLRAVDEALTEVDGAGAVVVVDQFEEVFTLGRDEAVRTRFVERLLAVAGSGRARVVLGIRADFYPHCARHPELIATLQDRQLLVGPMSAADLRAAVTGPARRAGLRVEPALVEALVTDAAGQPGALPLVSHALLETWRGRQGSTLTLAAYRAAGGVAEAIARTAEREYAALDPARQDLAEQIFLRLTTLGEGTEDTRRRVTFAELPAEPALLDRLAAARLITCEQDSVTVAHEALIRRWPRLRGWLAADRDRLRAHRRLTEAAGEWEQHGRDDAFLLQGKRLVLAGEVPDGRLNGSERDFLAAGRRREGQLRRRQRRRSRLTVSVLSAATVAVTLLAAVTTVQERRAAVERDIATADALAAESREQLDLKPELALLLARHAMAVRPTSGAEAALRQAVAGARVRSVLDTGQRQVFGVAYAPDGRRVATSGDDGTVRLWRTGPDGVARGGPTVLAGHRGEVWSPQFSPDGRFLAACGIDGLVTVWDLRAGNRVTVLRGHTGKVWNLAFSPRSDRLASTSDDATVRIWDPAAGGAPLRVLRAGTVRELGVAYSPDGRRLAASDGDGVIRLWTADGTGRPALLRGHTASVENLAFSPDGRHLAGAGTDGTARVWPVGGPGEPVVLRGLNAGTVETVAVSPDSRRIAAGGSDGTVRVFNADGDTDPLLLAGHDGPVWSLAFDATGGLLSGSGDGTARFWDAAYPGVPRVFTGHRGPVWTVAVDAAGQTMTSGGEDGTVRVWPLTGTGRPRVLTGPTAPVEAVAISADGGSVAGASDDGTVRVWDLGTGRTRTLGPFRGTVWSVAFLPGGRRLVAAGDDGIVRIWDYAGRGTVTELRGHQGAVRSVAAAPGGRTVASAGRDGTVRLWDTDGAEPARVLRGHRGGLVWRVRFSPDGRHLASGGDDGTIRIWDVAGGPAPEVLHGHRGDVWSLAYHPDGSQLASAGSDGGLHLWRLGAADPMTVLRGFGSSVEDVAVGPGGWFATAHDDGTVRVGRSDAGEPRSELEPLADRLSIRDFTADERTAYLAAE
jgi:WD40 repeat protein/transcriptional regulator with XRE-family HTH domain